MATRNAPIWVAEGTVKIYAPRSLEGKGKYYRIVYPFLGGYKDTTAKTEELAKSLAGKIARALKHGGEFRFQLSGNEFLDAYLNPTSREVNGRIWGANHSLNQKSILDKYVRPVIGTVACSEITNEMLKGIVRGANTIQIGEHLSSSLHGLVNWGHLEYWITERPEELLKGMTNTAKKIKGINRANESGENLLYIHPNEIPTHEDVARVAKAAADITGIWWYELMFILAAYSGMRLGEITDLDITQIDTKAKTIRIENQCLDVGGKKSRTLPKLGKFRTTVYPTITPMKYHLAEQLKRRIKEIEGMKEIPVLLDGTSRRLVFHNRRGSWISQSSFGSKIRRPAQKIAGWPMENGKYRWNFHSLRHVFCSYYLGDLNQSAKNVAICAGHSDVFTTLSMYVGASRDAIEKMSSAN
jgi:integrase